MRDVTAQKRTVDDIRWFVAVLAFLVIDYGRPQDIIPIGFLRPGLLAEVTLIYFLVTRQGFAKSAAVQIRGLWYFILLLALYIPFAVNTHWAYMTTKTMLMYMPFVLSVVVCVTNVQRMKVLVDVAVGLMVYIALYAMSHGGVGSGNYFLDENDVSLYINMWLPFCYFLFLQEEKKLKKFYYAGAFLTGLAGVIISFSRGGFVGLVCMVFFAWLVSPKKMLSATLICSVAIGAYLYTGAAYKAEMSTVTDTQEGTAQQRLRSWKAGWYMFLDNPLGVGGNNYQIRFPEYQGDDFTRSMWGRAAHSLWFTLLPELGVVGVFIFLRLLYFNIKDIMFVRRYSKVKVSVDAETKYLYMLSLAFAASLVGFFASATFLSVLYYAHYWYLTAMIIAMTNILRLKLEKSGHHHKTDSILTAYLHK